MSDKKLYEEIKDRETFQTMVNATASHEMRNPLNAIADQKENFDNIMEMLKQLYKFILKQKDSEGLAKVVENVIQKFR